MSRLFYPKLALENLKKNGRIYLPYIITCVVTAAMFYIINSLSLNEEIHSFSHSEVVLMLMNMGVGIVGIFAAVFLFYTNGFLMRQRQREFGLLNILGMEKRHITLTVFFENAFICLFTLGAGLGFGILLDKLMYMLLQKMTGGTAGFGFYISGYAAGRTAVFVVIVFLLLFLKSSRQVQKTSPAQLLNSARQGEKEPVAKPLAAGAGVLCLAGGYGISFFVKNPMLLLSLFFPAAILVIIGTYLLFSAGSVTLLKALKKNKSYYYKPNHFVSVSGLIYRMRQNAVGLGNICILSTMVLVMLSSTVSLWMGLDDAVRSQYTYDISVTVETPQESVFADTDRIAREAFSANGCSQTKKVQYRYLSVGALRQESDRFYVGNVEDYSAAYQFSDVYNLYFVPLEDYNRSTGKNEVLNSGQVLLYSDQTTPFPDVFQVGGLSFQVKEVLPDWFGKDHSALIPQPDLYMVIKNMDVMEQLDSLQKQAYGKNASSIRSYSGYSLDADSSQQKAAASYLAEKLSVCDWDWDYRVQSMASAYEESRSLYGGFLFIGIFLSILFVMAAVLIIYYKQISEGYEDAGRYEILQKVGMDSRQIKKNVRSQILTVFFLPLLTAGIHMTAALPALLRLLTLFSLSNAGLFLLCALCCYGVFALMYAAVYSLTARAYYRIVR